MIAQIGEGLAAGAAEVSQYIRNKPERDARLAEAKLRQATGEAKLQEFNRQAPLRDEQTQLELAKTRQELKQTQSANLKAATYSAFQRYEADGDTKHLNNFLAEAKANPVGRSLYGDVLRLDPLTRTPETEALLRGQGYTNADELFTDPDQMKNLVLATTADGGRHLVDMSEMYAGTGYAQHMSNQELETLSKRAVLQRALKGQESADTVMINRIKEEEGISTYEATKKYYASKKAGGSAGGKSKVERVADTIMQEDPEISRTDAIAQATKITEPRTAGIKDVEASNAIRAELDDAGFFEADLADPVARRKFGPKIAAIEKLADQQLTTEDKRTVRNLRSLTKLGGVAGEQITDAEAGVVDSMLRGAKSYITNEIEGTEGTAAYETFRNVFRNALYGASLTKTEVDAFTSAAGSLKQQAGPVLQKLLVQVQDVKQQLESVHQLNDEYIATYYLGSSLDDVDQVVAALEDRVELFKSMSKSTNMKVSATPTERPSLEEIFK